MPLRETLRTAPPNQTLRILADLDEQVDLKRLGQSLSGSRLERRERVLAALREVAGRGQERLRPFLETARQNGLVRSWQGFVIVSRLVVEATPAGIEALARRPEVAALVPESEIPAPGFSGEGEPTASTQTS